MPTRLQETAFAVFELLIPHAPEYFPGKLCLRLLRNWVHKKEGSLGLRMISWVPLTGTQWKVFVTGCYIWSAASNAWNKRVVVSLWCNQGSLHLVRQSILKTKSSQMNIAVLFVLPHSISNSNTGHTYNLVFWEK